jgi:hypothetical protein
MRKRTNVLKKLKANKNIQKERRLRDKFVEIENALCTSHKNQRDAEEIKAIKAIKKNSKYFFKYAKKYSTTKSCIGPLTAPNGQTITDIKQMSQLLKVQYESVFSKPKSIHADESEGSTSSSQKVLNDIKFDEKDIEKACKELKPNSAAGPDEIPAILLQKCREQLSKPLQVLWNHSLREGQIPLELKMAHITPIYKGGGKNKPSNYRPVALTSHVIKVFEKVVRNRLTEFLEENQLMNKGQHGFRRGRSCLSQLLSHHTQILNILESGSGADVLYLDFAKAFDKVDHGVLLHKLSKLGITDKVWHWLKAFLINRTQKVVIEGVKSDPSTVISGVPQGSVLGPLLFLILLGDIDQNTPNSIVTSFADDTRITGKINCENDIKLLQADLHTVSTWADENNMLFNDSKFELLRYGKKVEAKYSTKTGHEIEETSQVRDLGITMSDDASFSSHITKVTKTARALTGWILRVFSARDKLTMLTLFKSLVLPHLEYCCVLWNPAVFRYIQQIEGVQRTFTFKIQDPQLQDKNYWQRLKELKLYSLERRRERYTILYVFKILKGLVPNIGITARHHGRNGKICEIPPMNNRALQSVITKKSASFLINGPKLFNVLPSYIRNMEDDMDHIKAALDKFLQHIPDKPHLPGYPNDGGNSIINHARKLWANRDFGLWNASQQLPPLETSGTPRAADHSDPRRS